MATFLTAIPKVVEIKRSAGTVKLDEHHEGASIQQIRAFNKTKYPELETCGVDTETKDGVEHITFKPQAGTRG